jgi:hypothetical protein
MFTDEDFEDLATLARQHGLEEALRRWARRNGEEQAHALRAEYERRARSAQKGFPPTIIALPHGDPWYSGPLASDRYWPALRSYLDSDSGLSPAQVEKIDAASTKIVAYTNDPTAKAWSTKGLVVGHVQSGKTTNFTAVIAKAVDLGYNLVVVLSGIHNGLRRQTQERLQVQLCQLHSDGWIEQTTLDKDFTRPPHTFESILPPDEARKAVLCVVKKNAAVLRKLVAWLERSSRNGDLRRVKALIIDDEADQASVATPKINPLIRELLGILPRCTFVGYTATPFANVLIDPSVDDLYPEDFILNLPEPDGYFGTKMIFGRDELPDREGDGPVDGYDMVRVIPDDQAASLRPPRTGTFTPQLPPSLEHAVLWFWLATAARRARGAAGHSTMLLHTSMNTTVHEAFRPPLLALQRELLADLVNGDADRSAQLSKLWEEESSRVPAAEFGLSTPEFSAVEAHLEAVITETGIVLDNSKSMERLSYGNAPVTAIAIGGNTLSRGLTLEGLVVSYFIRAAKAYDTLLQMGRWFGFRRGYEDLPRIFMTNELRNWFRHLATVEEEVRNDIARYEEQVLTPRAFGVRIRTHPTLLVTQKLGAARQAFTSYGGRRVQVRYFEHKDADWLNMNLVAAQTLVADLDAAAGAVEVRADGSTLWRDVPVSHVQTFLRNYEVHEDSPDLDRQLVLSYIDKELAAGSLSKWSVAVMGSADHANGEVALGTRTFGRIVRARLLDDVTTRADIKTLMSKEHRVADLDISPADARGMPEEKLMNARNADPGHKNQGLLLLYPIDPMSSPDNLRAGARHTRERLAAVGDVIGMGLVFPGNADLTVQNSYISVDLSAVTPLEEPDETEDVIDMDAEDSDVA